MGKCIGSAFMLNVVVNILTTEVEVVNKQYLMSETHGRCNFDVRVTVRP